MTNNTPQLFRIACLLISVRTLHDGLLRIGRDFLDDARGCEPDIRVNITQQDIDAERLRSPDGGAGFSDRYIETLAVCRQISEIMPSFGRFLMHGSAVAVDGEGYLFTAPSGTGKSTHVRFWREMLGDRAVMVNDDKPFVGVGDSGATVYGSPWQGKHRLGGNISVPLRAVCVLGRAKENSIEEITSAEAMPTLIKQIYRPDSHEMLAETLGLIDRLNRTVKFYRLGCNLDPDSGRVSYEMMRNNKKEG
ncbi:MAG: hypothetical protein K5647_02490 [Clostridiales bacterium]|nr:hypothetical protein [Clostridiales bacterium]